MHFCEKCGNMYYIKIQTEDKDNLIYYCRKCGYEDKDITNNTKNLCVSKTHVLNNTELYSQVINKYTKLDPTLPRINNIDCPNKDCLTNKNTKEGEKSPDKEVIYIRYNDSSMKYVYLCCNCDTVWKN
tara:strand:- start:561 stop:944 length:384 start_codon:yes stop_codon:yes gene_type:complete